jgi:hypothetical protein
MNIQTDDNDLPLSITHARDTIVVDGKLKQDYRTLYYMFEGGIEARVYLDDVWTISVLKPHVGTSLPPPVFRYMQQRFRLIKQLGGPEGYTTLWEVP